MAKQPLVTVYKNGDPKQSKKTSLRNARDLVNAGLYTWQPGASYLTPASLAPVQPKAIGPEPAQRVLDSQGHNANRTIQDVIGEAEEEVVEAAEFEVVADEAVVVEEEPAHAEVVDEVVEEAQAEAQAEEVTEAEAPKRKGGRQKKTA